MLVTKDFVLVHVPKTGGTFLNQLVKEHCEVLYEKTHAPYSELPADYRGLPALAFVRNPWSWYVSWWTHQFCHQADPLVYEAWPFKAFEIARGDFGHSLRLAFARTPDYYSALFQSFAGEARVGRYEKLREDFVAFLGGKHPRLSEAVLEAPAVNVGRHKPFQGYYTSKDARRVEESWVAQTFGYSLYVRFRIKTEQDVYEIHSPDCPEVSDRPSLRSQGIDGPRGAIEAARDLGEMDGLSDPAIRVAPCLS